jgi:ankyrin repeat protein
MLSKQETTFLKAAKDGNLDQVKECIQNGVDREAKDSDGQTALHKATSKGHLDIVRYLAETCQVDEDVVRWVNQNEVRRTMLQIAHCSDHLDVVRWLIEAGHINMEAKEYNEFTALHLIIAQYLIAERYVNLEAKDEYGYTALHLATCYGHLDIVQYLIEQSKKQKPNVMDVMM